jgi:hypothetical protein
MQKPFGMWSLRTNYRDFLLARMVSDYVRSRHGLTEPLPKSWLELLAKLEAPTRDAAARAPSGQPKLSEDGSDRKP